MAWTDKLADFLRLNDGEQAYVGYPQMQVGLNKPRQAGYTTGFLEGATGMDSMQPKNPITDPNFESYEQGKNTGEAAGIAAMALPAYASLLRAGAPKAYNALENYMVKTGGMISLEAYHGTPHEIQGKFDMAKVGTGEGAQVYGHGMYFAENPKVAKSYADMDTSMAKMFLQTNDNDILKAIDNAEKHYDFVKQKFAPNQNTLESNQRTIDYLKNKWLKDQEIEGNLYKVDIPDEYIPTMMEWDKSMGEQSPFVKKAVNSLKKHITPEMMDELGGDLSVLFGKDVTPAQFLNTWEIIHPESKVGIGEELLNQAGVKGVKYLDNFSREKPFSVAISTKKGPYAETEFKTKEQAENYIKEKQAEGFTTELKNIGTHNFVVFEPSDVKILEKNGVPTRKELIQQQIDKIE
jgi:hypothetical protein